MANFSIETFNLATLVEYSNAFSITVIIVCFLAMAVFIARLRLEQIGTPLSMMPGSYIPATHMRGVHNPVTVVLQPDKTSSIRDGAWLEIHSQIPVLVQGFWGVSISNVYSAVFQQWAVFDRQFRENILFDGLCLIRGEQHIIGNVQEKTCLHVTTGRGSEFDLGAVPRSQYPLTIVTVVNDKDLMSEDNMVICTVTFLHLSDSVCPGKSHIISQYVRTRTGQPYCLQPLYMASGEGDHVEEEPPDTHTSVEHTEGQEVDHIPETCVVCQCEAVSRVLLPCRHTCVCDTCFQRLDKCPMCRAAIMSYFRLDGRQDEDLPEVQDMAEDSDDTYWLYRLSDSITNFLGLRIE